MTRRRTSVAALWIGAAVLLSAGCGSSDEDERRPLPGDAVAALNQRLDEVQRRYEDGTQNNNAGACRDIETDSYRAIDATVEGLPADVDSEVRNALEESLARLQELTRESCSEVEQTRTEPDTTPQEAPPPVTVPQQTVPEQTDTEETVPRPPQDKGNKKKDKQNGTDGNGNGDNGGAETPGPTGGAQPDPGAGEG